MKKGVMGRIVFTFIFTIFSLSLILAVNIGKCDIVARADCDSSEEGYIIMGLSDPTDAHGENYSSTGMSYPYVLCCNIGDGNRECKTTAPNNKIIGLSSSTNAHAQIPSSSDYLTSVCYGNFSCRKLTTGPSCAANEIGILSLSADTNAHVSNFNDSNFPVKICCGGSDVTASRCSLTSAIWKGTLIQNNKVTAGSQVYLQVAGIAECNNLRVSFEVRKENGDIVAAPQTRQFKDGVLPLTNWVASYAKCGLLGGNCKYYFNASLINNPKVSISNKNDLLEVEEQSAEECPEELVTCDGYTDEARCNANACNTDLVVQGGNGDIVDCNDPSVFCGCSWNTDAGTCGFSWTEISQCGSPDEGGCNYGCTLCHSTETGDYCNVGNTCPVGNEPESIPDGICEFGEGCTSDDCLNGDTDSCNQGLFCSLGKCFSFEDILEPTADSGRCDITQSITKGCDTEPVGFKTIEVTGTWTGPAGSAQTQCESYKEAPITVPCPAQIQLPFFDYIEMIIAIAIIALIYISFMFRKKILKFLKRKKHK